MSVSTPAIRIRRAFPRKARPAGSVPVRTCQAPRAKACRQAAELRSVRELKFLSPVIPPQDSLLRVELVLTDTGDGGIDVRGAISADGVQKTKIKAIFV